MEAQAREQLFKNPTILRKIKQKEKPPTARSTSTVCGAPNRIRTCGLLIRSGPKRGRWRTIPNHLRLYAAMLFNAVVLHVFISAGYILQQLFHNTTILRVRYSYKTFLLCTGSKSKNLQQCNFQFLNRFFFHVCSGIRYGWEVVHQYKQMGKTLRTDQV